MSLYPLPAVLFLLSLIVLLVILALVYVFVLRKSNICGGMEGHAGDEEEGKEPSANGGDGGGESTGEIAPENTYGEAGPGGGNTENIDGGDLTDAPPPQEPVLDSKKPAGGVANTGGDNESKAPAEGTTPTAEGGVVAEEGEGDVIPASEEEPLSIGGKILVQFTYKPAANKINLTIIRAGEMPPPERGGAETIRVHLCILPQRKQRFRTKAVPTSKGVFNETFEFIHMTQDVVENCAIRLRVYGTQRFSKRIIGEVRMPLSQVDLTSALCDEQIWKTLSPKGLVAIYHNIDEEDEPDIDDW